MITTFLQDGKTFTKTGNLFEWSENPKTSSPEALARLKYQITKLGQHTPLLVMEDGTVLGGNQRLKVYREIAMENVWISIVYPQNDNEKMEFALSSNDHVGIYIEDKMQEIIENYDIDWGQYTAQFEELDTLGDLIADEESPVIEDEAPQVSQDPAISQLGEVYQLGRHRLMCGDTTKIEDVEKLMNGKKADFVYTDPPYGINIVQGKHIGGGGETHFGHVGGGKIVPVNDYSPVIGDETTQTAIDSYNLCASLEIEKMIFWGGNYYANSLPNSSCWVVWDKQNTGNFADCEMAWTNIKKSAKIYKQTWNGMVREGESGKRVHPTQKPVGLAFFCLTEFGEKEDNVLDLFGGSGSTLIACEQTNRTCYMMELDPKYVDVIRKRYAKFIGQEENWQETTPIIAS